jgi:nicotinamidase-related amidase
MSGSKFPAMSKQEEPTPAPVIVIDLQAGMFDGVMEPPIDDAEVVASRARAVIHWARSEGRGVAFIRHDGPEGDPLAPGSSGWPIWPALGQGEDEPTFPKSVGDAFTNPDLGEWVAGLGAGEVILLGAQTDFCVAATMKGAMAAGLAVTIVSDAHSTLDSPVENAAAIRSRYNDEFAAAGARLVTTATLTGN